MTVEEYTHIQVSKSNKEKLNNLKLFERETMNFVFGMLIEFGEKNGFKNLRIKNLTKKLEIEKIGNNKIKQRAIVSTAVQ